MRLKGSYTIENSVIIPLFTIIMVVLITLCFYLHDNVILKNAVFQASLQYEDLDSKKQDSSMLKQSVTEYLKEKTLLLHDINMNFSKDKDSFCVEGSAKVRHMNILKEMNQLDRECTVKSHKSAEFIRMIEAISMVRKNLNN